MKCSVTFRHMKPSDPIRAYAEDRIDKITKLIEEGTEAQVVLSLEKHLHVAHLELLTHGSLRLRCIEKSPDMYGSIDQAVEKIMRQAQRYRSKIKNHRESTNGRELPHKVIDVVPENDEEEQRLPDIVRQETIIAKEMSVDDAVMQMDLLNQDFLVFTNTISQRVNVVYRLPAGQYGLIEAQTS
ncbi:MAG: ribosome-associated translation inhibitor RaiA [Deltaproteobacteria bacterium]|nr:ribosome-associated translation inhibitor RaiA [Deltaproteobacteria bacterium]